LSASLHSPTPIGYQQQQKNKKEESIPTETNISRGFSGQIFAASSRATVDGLLHAIPPSTAQIDSRPRIYNNKLFQKNYLSNQ
jgi:hypothetical protein